MKGIVGRKIGMSQVFAKSGELIPVTVVQVPSNVVTQIKTMETDKYCAIQLGVEDKKEKASNKPEMGHVAKANTAPKRIYKELRLDEETVANYELGKELTVDIFEAGEMVDVQGTSKGKGFQGVIKRHGQSRGPMAHGSRYHRRPGSMGAVAPAVFKGKNLPGQTGGETVTVQNLEIIMVDVETSTIMVKGNIPGAKKSFVFIKSTIKNVQPTEKRDLVSYAVATEEVAAVETEAVDNAVEVKEEE
ncbi:MAG: 50S ribosomal protein L3 [Mycoplasmatales bacterium]